MNQDESEENFRNLMLADLSSGDPSRSTDALLSLTYNDANPQWVERILVQCLDGRYGVQERSLAITCFGHLARIHGAKIDRQNVVAILRELVDDPLVGGLAEDALDDVLWYSRDQIGDA